MNLKVLREMRDRSPFRKFNIHLTNGEVLPCLHPDLLSFPRTGEIEIFNLWVGPDWNLVEAGEVARISLVKAKAA